MASTRSRPRGREHARPPGGGAAAEHATKIVAIAITGIVVVIAFLALTSTGHVICAATQHFMLFYAGVFALIGLCASVGLGLVATDRMFMHPGHRVLVQSAHRAASFGAVAFLIVHIVTEILAQRVHVLDAMVPFLSPYRTFYIGLGTISSDLIILLVITGIMRGRFNAGGKAWRWRAIHYSAYASFAFGVWHGLLAGRPGKPYVDWSYGFLVALVLLGLAVRIFSNSLKPKEALSAPPVPQAAASASAPMRAAAMFAQLAASRARQGGGFASVTGPQQAVSTPLGAPVLTALPAGAAPAGTGQAMYEPGYDGPPRYLGAPRSTVSGPLPRLDGTGAQPRYDTAPQPVFDTGAQPRYDTAPQPVYDTGAQPVYASGAQPRYDTAAQPVYETGPQPRYDTGPQPAYDTDPLPLYNTGGLPRVPTGPFPAAGAGPLPLYASGPMPRVPTGSFPVADPRSVPPYPSGPMPRVPSGPVRAATGPVPRVPTGSFPVVGDGPRNAGPHHSDPYGSAPYDSRYRTGGGYGPVPGPGPGPRGGDPRQRPGRPVPPGRPGPGDLHPGHPSWPAAGYDGVKYLDPDMPPWEAGVPEADIRLRYREPGPGMPGYRGSRDHRYGGDVR